MLPSAMRGLGDVDFKPRPGFRRLCEWPRLPESVSEPRPARILPERCQEDGAAEGGVMRPAHSAGMPESRRSAISGSRQASAAARYARVS